MSAFEGDPDAQWNIDKGLRHWLASYLDADLLDRRLFPFSVVMNFWFLLLGFSGTVNSMRPAETSGSICFRYEFV